MKRDEQQAAAEEQKKREEALRKKAMFEEVLEIDAEDPIALFGLGNALSALGEWAKAEAALAKACTVQKDNSPVYLAHGKALEMLGREADAIAVYKAGMAVASKKGDLMPLKEMERRMILLEAGKK
jgi:tetratricopeptide (TPR) repeat protein